MRAWLPVLAVTCLLACHPVHAAPTEIVRDRLVLEGKQIPLPPGEWRIVSRTTTATPPLSSVALMRLRAETVDAAILVQASPRRAKPGWGTAEACRRTDLVLARIRHESDHDGSCAWVAHVTPSARNIDPAWATSVRAAIDEGWRLPTAWIDVGFRVTDPRGAFQVRYLFDPSSVPPPRPLSAAAIRSLTGWTETVWDGIEDGFRNNLDSAIPDWPPSETSQPRAELPRPSGGGGVVGHLGLKTITYRLFGTLTDLSVNYLWLGSLPSASGLAVVGGVASSTLYFVHELVWSRFETPSSTTIALPGVGTEGPFPATR